MALKKPIVLNETAQEGNKLLAELVAVQKATVLASGGR